MKITLAQLNYTVGDFKGNAKKIIAALKQNQKSDLVVFTELCVSGYPPEDMVLRPEFIAITKKYVNKIVAYTKNSSCDALIGAPWEDDGKIYNAALLISKGKIIYKQYKHDLPNYGIFDEKRVFACGPLPAAEHYKGWKMGILICEDTWNKKACKALKGADFVISMNASPYGRTKHKQRLKVLANAVDAAKAPILYVNQVTGHDDLVFDGGSFVMASNGNIIKQMDFFKEDTGTFDIDEIIEAKPKTQSRIDETGHIYQAMMLGLKDYKEKNDFPGVIIGLSGGIDSAISAAIAVDALGNDKVKLVMMPTRYTSKESLKDARKMAANLGVELDEIDIQPVVDLLRLTLQPHFKGKKEDVTEENLQSRVRGIVLMALSNKLGHLVLSTGNKSEMATGYATLYGDMCGGYNVIKDIYKTMIFKICNWRNKNIPQGSRWKKPGVIPQNIIDKPPTAELKHDQKDEDSLPPYQKLDKILFNFVELQNSADEIVKKGFSRKMVDDVEKLLYRGEYKRRQSAPGVKISSKPFGRDRRYPITNKFLDQ